VYRGSENYARVAEPLLDLNSRYLKLNFQLEKPQNPELFGITKEGGIVYVKNKKKLKQFNDSQLT